MKKITEPMKKYWVYLVGIIIIAVASLLMNYNIESRWVSIVKQNSKTIDRYKNKIKVQYSYSIDMKEAMKEALPKFYQRKLRDYILQNNIQVTERRILSDIKYYKLVTIAICNQCEDITLDRYILTNDLYRYKGLEEWRKFRKDAFIKYMVQGRQVMTTYYDDSKVIMPVREWVKVNNEISKIVEEESFKLLEGLRAESILYHNLK